MLLSGLHLILLRTGKKPGLWLSKLNFSSRIPSSICVSNKGQTHTSKERVKAATLFSLRTLGQNTAGLSFWHIMFHTYCNPRVPGNNGHGALISKALMKLVQKLI